MPILLEDLSVFIRWLDLPVALVTFGGIVVTSLIIRFGLFKGSFLALLGTMAGIFAFHDQYVNMFKFFLPITAAASPEPAVPATPSPSQSPSSVKLSNDPPISLPRDTATVRPPMEWKVVTQPEAGVSYTIANVAGVWQRVQQVPAGTAGLCRIFLSSTPQGYQGYYANYGCIQPSSNVYAGNGGYGYRQFVGGGGGHHGRR